MQSINSEDYGEVIIYWYIYNYIYILRYEINLTRRERSAVTADNGQMWITIAKTMSLDISHTMPHSMKSIGMVQMKMCWLYVHYTLMRFGVISKYSIYCASIISIKWRLINSTGLRMGTSAMWRSEAGTDINKIMTCCYVFISSQALFYESPLVNLHRHPRGQIMPSQSCNQTSIWSAVLYQSSQYHL